MDGRSSRSSAGRRGIGRGRLEGRRDRTICVDARSSRSSAGRRGIGRGRVEGYRDRTICVDARYCRGSTRRDAARWCGRHAERHGSGPGRGSRLTDGRGIHHRRADRHRGRYVGHHGRTNGVDGRNHQSRRRGRRDGVRRNGRHGFCREDCLSGGRGSRRHQCEAPRYGVHHHCEELHRGRFVAHRDRNCGGDGRSRRSCGRAHHGHSEGRRGRRIGVDGRKPPEPPAEPPARSSRRGPPERFSRGLSPR